MSSFDPAFDRSTKVTVISRSLRTKNPWYVSVFCRFDLLDGFFHLKNFSQRIAVQESHFVWCIMYSCWIEPGWRSVDSVATIVLFRIVKNNDGYPIKAEDWFCVWIFCKEFEDRRDFKCNNFAWSDRGTCKPVLFCENIHTHSKSLPRNKLNIASSFRNNSPSSKQ